jgi:hypothetical protein
LKGCASFESAEEGAMKNGAGTRAVVGAVVAMVMGLLSATSEASTGPASDGQVETRGCCSHHKGVCGCSGHTEICCDDTPSPTCGC